MAEVIKEISANPAWLASTAYSVGDRVHNDTPLRLYECITAGTSAASGGPTGTGSDITDNTVHWKYIADIDYSGATALQDWEDAVPADLTTDGNQQTARLRKGTEFFDASGSILVVSNHVADATNFIKITTAAGESILDSTANPADYDASKGVAVRGTPGYSVWLVSFSGTGNNFVVIERIQWRSEGSRQGVFEVLSVNTDWTVRDSLFSSDNTHASPYMFSGTALDDSNFSNLFFFADDNNGNALQFRTDNRAEYCTFVMDSAETSSATGIDGSAGTGNEVQNCAFGNFSTDVSSTGFTATNSGNNATTLASGPSNLLGTGNRFSITFSATQPWIDAAEAGGYDLQVTTGSDTVPDLRTRAAVITLAVDAYGTTRSGSAPTIGAFEESAAAVVDRSLGLIGQGY